MKSLITLNIKVATDDLIKEKNDLLWKRIHFMFYQLFKLGYKELINFSLYNRTKAFNNYRCKNEFMSLL